MDTCDVLIVGAGPAGSSCAWRLCQAGLDVLILDRKPFPRDKVCAGWITPQVVVTLDIDTDDYARGRVLQEITGFRTGLIGGAQVETRYDRPVSYGIRRCEFDHYLLERSGARCRLGEPVASLDERGQGWLVNGRIEAPVIVGAGGHFCPVARRLGARRHSQAAVVAALEIEFEAGTAELARGSVEANVPELFFCDDLAGYGWCFRKGNFLNIGLGRVDATGLRAHIDSFCDFLRQCGKVRCQVPRRMHGHAYQLHEQVRPKLVAGRALLVGDAAGLAYPQSGEGIRPAIESGLLAAETILAADGNYDHRRLEPYASHVIERLGEPRRGSLTDRLPASWLRWMAARLLSSRTFSRRVVLERWFLHMHDPALEIDDLAAPAPAALQTIEAS